MPLKSRFQPISAIRKRLMLDLLYIALAALGFLAFATAVRGCEHL